MFMELRNWETYRPKCPDVHDETICTEPHRNPSSEVSVFLFRTENIQDGRARRDKPITGSMRIALGNLSQPCRFRRRCSKRYGSDGPHVVMRHFENDRTHVHKNSRNPALGVHKVPKAPRAHGIPVFTGILLPWNASVSPGVVLDEPWVPWRRSQGQ